MSEAHRHTDIGSTFLRDTRRETVQTEVTRVWRELLEMTLSEKRLENEYRGCESILLGLSERSDMVVAGNADGCQRVVRSLCLQREGQTLTRSRSWEEHHGAQRLD